MFKFIRTKWTIVLLFSIIGCILITLRGSVTQLNIVQIRNNQNDAILHVTQKPRKPYDVVINSYMRSGSSFTGQLLGFRSDVFYWYEPLWNYNSGITTYWGQDKICYGSSCSDKIVPVNSRQPVQHHMDKVWGTIRNITSCRFEHMQPAVAETMTDVLSGPVWETYRQCRRNSTVKECLQKHEMACKTAKHRMLKIVRLTVDNLEDILTTNKNVKVLQLLRDPRAIINSRITTAWYSLIDNPSRITINAEDLCRRMMYDLTSGIALKKKFPDRFAFVMFEDLQDNLSVKAKYLYNYLGIVVNNIDSKIKDIEYIEANKKSVKKQVNDTFSEWWRSQMSFSAMKATDAVCLDFYKAVGYHTFTDESQLRNKTTKSYSFSKDILLEYIEQNLQYDITRSSIKIA